MTNYYDIQNDPEYRERRNKSTDEMPSQQNARSSSFRFIVSNARSLAPKISSLIDNFNELDLNLAIITESWLRPGTGLAQDSTDLEHGEGLKIIHKSRPSKRGRTAGGGVAIIYNKDRIRLSERKIKAGRAEIVCASGKLPKAARTVVVFAVYIPPRTRAPQVENIQMIINDEISRAKTDFHDPIIVMGGDFNKKPFLPAIVDFPDVSVIQTGPTRGDETLDFAMTNIENCTASLRQPLESDDGQKRSNHKTILVDAPVGNEHRFKWKRVRTRPRTKKGDRTFRSLIENNSWQRIRDLNDAEEKANALVEELDSIMTKAYPVVTKKIRNTDDPWINDEIRKKIKSRKELFEREHRSAAWKELKRGTNKMIKDAKHNFYNKFTELAIKSGDPALYYKVVGRLKDRRAPENFCVTSLFPDKSPEEAAELVADFFCLIGDKFDPLTNDDLPEGGPPEDRISVTVEQVSRRLRECKKPRGLLQGDIFPELITEYVEALAPIVTEVINAAYSSELWPSVWKLETVTSIPKTTHPSHLGELRNISCTPLLSKVMEFFTL